MAPEQASGSRKGLSPATDVYGLGAILYELLTGSPPFRNGTVMETVVEVLERDPLPPRELRPEIPKELETICLKCLEKNPEGSLSVGRRTGRRARTAPSGRGHRHHLAASPPAPLASPRARAGRAARRALSDRLDRPVQLLRVSELRDFRHHYTIQGVLALWAVSAVVFQTMTRAGWQADRVRVLQSAADILFVTLEIKLFERVEQHAAGGRSGRPLRHDAHGRLSDSGGGLRALVAHLARLDDHGHGHGRPTSGSTSTRPFPGAAESSSGTRAPISSTPTSSWPGCS